MRRGVPTTIAEALGAVGLQHQEVVRWGTTPSTSKSGIYIVSLTSSLDRVDGALPKAPLATRMVDRWLHSCPDLKLRNARPTAQLLMNQLGRFWLSDEVILYIGKATSLSARCGGYYRTPIGALGPHSGGYFIKLLSNLDQLWVHYAWCDAPQLAEHAILGRFCGNVSDRAKRTLMDPTRPLPFANLEWPKGACKDHGLTGVRT